MTNLRYDIIRVLRRAKLGSHGTRAERKKHCLMGEIILSRDFPGLRLNNIGQKHVDAIVCEWTSQRLSGKTIANRLSSLRMLLECIGKPNLLSKNNADYGIEPITTRNNELAALKATMAKQHDLTQVSNKKIMLSLLLQEQFGLRKQECLLFQPHTAYQPAKEGRKDRIYLQGSWTKGGKERWIPIVNESQRQFLDYLLTAFQPGESMIPQNMTLKQQISIYDYQTKKVGMHKLHGLRYAYAQSRYYDLLGFPCPAQGGPSLRQLPPEQRLLVRQARLQISKELGHEREDVVLIYLGS